MRCVDTSRRENTPVCNPTMFPDSPSILSRAQSSREMRQPTKGLGKENMQFLSDSKTFCYITDGNITSYTAFMGVDVALNSE